MTKNSIVLYPHVIAVLKLTGNLLTLTEMWSVNKTKYLRLRYANYFPGNIGSHIGQLVQERCNPNARKLEFFQHCPLDVLIKRHVSVCEIVLRELWRQSPTATGSHSHTLLWRHNGRDGVSNHQPRGYLLNRLFRRWSKKTSKLRVTGLCAGNSPVTGEFPAQGPVMRKMFPFDDVITLRRIMISDGILLLSS